MMATLIGQNKFCGPFALAYVMGSDTDTAADLLGSKDIKGVGPDVFTQALSQAGIQVETVMPKWAARIEKERFTKTRYELAPDGTLRKRSIKRFTLTQWLKYAAPKPGEMFIVGVTRHWFVIHDGRWFDNQHPQGGTLDACPYLRWNVGEAWRLLPVQAPAQVAA
jgi:hypothetical protein